MFRALAPEFLLHLRAGPKGQASQFKFPRLKSGAFTVIARWFQFDLCTLWIDAVQRTRERNRFAHMIKPADPGHGTFDAHAKAAMRNTSVLAQIEIPAKGRLGQPVLMNALQ